MVALRIAPVPEKLGHVIVAVPERVPVKWYPVF
jgi:hypothetical protein